MISYGTMHVLGPEGAPPVVIFQDGNFLNPLSSSGFYPSRSVTGVCQK